MTSPRTSSTSSASHDDGPCPSGAFAVQRVRPSPVHSTDCRCYMKRRQPLEAAPEVVDLLRRLGDRDRGGAARGRRTRTVRRPRVGSARAATRSSAVMPATAAVAATVRPRPGPPRRRAPPSRTRSMTSPATRDHRKVGDEPRSSSPAAAVSSRTPMPTVRSRVRGVGLGADRLGEAVGGGDLRHAEGQAREAQPAGEDVGRGGHAAAPRGRSGSGCVPSRQPARSRAAGTSRVAGRHGQDGRLPPTDLRHRPLTPGGPMTTTTQRRRERHLLPRRRPARHPPRLRRHAHHRPRHLGPARRRGARPSPSCAAPSSSASTSSTPPTATARSSPTS